MNDWAKVEDLYRLPTTSKMIKIQFTSQQMVQTALTKGIVILHQFTPHWNVEEMFVRLKPCHNCFSYDHKIRDCPHEKKMCCTFCGEEHKQQECKVTVPKCINCGEAHRTLAAACKIRKELIKKRSKEITERSKSRNRQGGMQDPMGTQSYSEAARERRGPGTTSTLTKEETNEMLTVIMSAIVYGHYMEALVPGSFQGNVNEVYRLNGLRTANFSSPTMTISVMEACREVFREKSKEETRRETEEDRSGTRTSDEHNLEMDLDDDAIAQEEREIEGMIRRHRESLALPSREDKRKKQEREMEMTQSPPPPPPTTTKTNFTASETGAILKSRDGMEERVRETERERERESDHLGKQQVVPDPGHPRRHHSNHSLTATLRNRWASQCM